MEGALSQAIGQVLLDPKILGLIVLSALYGVLMGAIPGLTATMGVALVVPLTYFLPPVPALAVVVTLVACAIFSGDVPGALLRIPGTPSSAAYLDDLYADTQRGKAERALGVCLLFSVAGGLLGAGLLAAFAPRLARVATLFTSVEYFWFYLLGLGCAVVVSRGSPLRGALALLIGLLLSTVGLSAVHGEARFTLGRPELYQGINFIPAMIGLFGLSEVLRNVVRPPETVRLPRPDGPGSAPSLRTRMAASVSAVFGEAARLLGPRRGAAVRSGLIGSFVGMLPGAGADIAAWVSYGISKRFSRDRESYGRGSLEGVADATAANNAALAGAWVPALAFGIPGDSITALVIGILLMKDVKLGPNVFEAQAPLVYGIYLVFLLANLVLLPVGFLAIKAGGRLVRVPRHVLLPVIVLFCLLGAYSINGSYFDVAVMGAMGVLGFFLERWGVPLAPVVLGIVLGGPLEESFVQTLTKAGTSPAVFFSRPLALVLAIASIALWLSPLVTLRRRPR